MKKSLQVFVTVAVMTTATVILSAPIFARGGGGSNIMNSPGYERRLQESRQQLSQPDMRPSSSYRRTWRHRRGY
jgi:hypothetical protein